MAKNVLKIDYDDELDFLLFGIVSGFKDYRICYELNLALDINLARTQEHKLIVGKNNSELKYVRFEYKDEYEQQYILLCNRNEKQLLIPELNMIDFFLMIDPAEGIESDVVLKNIKNIQLVSTAFTLKPTALKSKHNLLNEE